MRLILHCRVVIIGLLLIVPVGCSSRQPEGQPADVTTDEDTVAAVVASSPLAPADPAPPLTEDQTWPFETPLNLGSFCPFEYGCGFGRPWLVTAPLAVYSTKGDLSSVVAHLDAGDCIVPTQAQMMVAQPGLVVLNEAFQGFHAGDTIYILSYGAEAIARLWAGGRAFDAESFWGYRNAPATKLSEPVNAWWVGLQTEGESWLAFTEQGRYGGVRVSGVNIGSIDSERLSPPVEACPQ